MTVIAVTRRFSVCPLLAIENSEFAHWYGLGVFWAVYGEQQGRGPYEDRYLIANISRNIQTGRFDSLASPWFSHIGFYLGIAHGGMIDPQTLAVRTAGTLVILTDPDFTKGYYVGRDYYFTEAPLEGRPLSDRLFIAAVHNWALEYHTWHEPDETLRYCLGCRIGELSGALIPQTVPVIS